MLLTARTQSCLFQSGRASLGTSCWAVLNRSATLRTGRIDLTAKGEKGQKRNYIFPAKALRRKGKILDLGVLVLWREMISNRPVLAFRNALELKYEAHVKIGEYSRVRVCLHFGVCGGERKPNHSNQNLLCHHFRDSTTAVDRRGSQAL